METDDLGRRAHLVLSRDTMSSAERTALVRAAERAELVRVARGAYLPAAAWSGWDDDTRYRMLIHAVAAVLPGDVVVSHDSAAALWRLPTPASWPDVVHVTAPPALGGRSNAHLFRHTTVRSASPEAVDGIAVTTVARTAVDIARTTSLGRAVVAIDAALDPARSAEAGRAVATRELLQEELERVAPRQGRARAMRALDFADGRAGSVGESLSRVTMARLRAPTPILQRTFPNPRGGSWSVDFWWPEHCLAGEFDGHGKYLRDDYLHGRSTAEVVIEEKRREDAIRAQGARFVRWGWAEARNPRQLGAVLAQAGLPVRY